MSFLLEKKGSDLQPSMFNYQKVPFAKFQTAAQVEKSPYFLYRWWDSHQVWKTTPLTPLKPPSFWVYPPFDRPSNCLLDMSSNSRIVPQNPDSSLKKSHNKDFVPSWRAMSNTERWHGSIHNVESLEVLNQHIFSRVGLSMTSVPDFYGGPMPPTITICPRRAPHVASG